MALVESRGAKQCADFDSRRHFRSLRVRLIANERNEVKDDLRLSRSTPSTHDDDPVDYFGKRREVFHSDWTALSRAEADSEELLLVIDEDDNVEVDESGLDGRDENSTLLPSSSLSLTLRESSG